MQIVESLNWLDVRQAIKMNIHGIGLYPNNTQILTPNVRCDMGSPMGESQFGQQIWTFQKPFQMSRGLFNNCSLLSWSEVLQQALILASIEPNMQWQVGCPGRIAQTSGPKTFLSSDPPPTWNTFCDPPSQAYRQCPIHTLLPKNIQHL